MCMYIGTYSKGGKNEVYGGSSLNQSPHIKLNEWILLFFSPTHLDPSLPRPCDHARTPQSIFGI